MDLPALIALRRQGRSLEALARSSNGLVTKQSWFNYAGGRDVKRLPDPRTVRGIARALGVNQATVLLAAAQSTGKFDITDSTPRLIALLPPERELDLLTDDDIASVLSMIRLLLETRRTVAAGREPAGQAVLFDPGAAPDPGGGAPDQAGRHLHRVT